MSDERQLFEAARAGDEKAFALLLGPYEAQLRAHWYRMLGSFADAEDALQDTMLRAWSGLARFESRSSLRSWLYRIATNASLRMIEKRPKRVLPIDYSCSPSRPRGSKRSPPSARPNFSSASACPSKLTNDVGATTALAPTLASHYVSWRRRGRSRRTLPHAQS